MCYTQVYSTQELTGLVNNWNPQMYTTQESSGLVNKLKLSGIHYIYTGIHLRRGILDNVWPTSSTTSKRTWLNTANLTSNSSSRGVSPSSPYLSLWLASIPFPHHHCLCLQLGSRSEPHGSWHDRQQTALRLALEHQSFSRRPGMAPLAIIPVTGWRRLHPTCRQFRQVPVSSFSVHGRQIPWENQHCLRVPRLLLAWLSGLLFQSHQIPPLPRREVLWRHVPLHAGQTRLTA